MNTDFPGKCWDSGSKIAYDVGKHQLENGCGEITCTQAFTIHTKTSVWKVAWKKQQQIVHMGFKLKLMCISLFLYSDVDR